MNRINQTSLISGAKEPKIQKPITVSWYNIHLNADVSHSEVIDGIRVVQAVPSHNLFAKHLLERAGYSQQPNAPRPSAAFTQRLAQEIEDALTKNT